MAITSENEIAQWVDERLATLGNGHGEPDVDAALEKLMARSNTRTSARRWIWTASLTVAASLCLIAMPAPRALAERCLSCSVALWQTLAAAGPGHANLIPAAQRKPAPDFTLNDASGRPVRLSDFKGKVVVLNFWATWCHGCQTEIPWFIEFQRIYRNRDFAMLGISRDDDGWKAVRPYLARKQLNYPVMIGTEAIATQYGAEQLPVTLLIDKSGHIAARHEGVVRKSDCQAEIEALL